jgi:hypothetical protein
MGRTAPDSYENGRVFTAEPRSKLGEDQGGKARTQHSRHYPFSEAAHNANAKL